VVAHALATTPGVEVMSCQQLMPELTEKLVAVELAVFIDAAVDVPAGAIRTARVQAAASTGLGHHASPAALLALSHDIYGRSPDAFLISVGAASLEFGEALSAEVAAAVPQAIAAVQTVIGR